MKIPIVYNARSVLQRPVSTALTALGIALVVAVFIGMLALANGFRTALIRTGSDSNVMLLRKGADSELSSGLDRGQASIISSFPHIATGSDGRALISPEVYVLIPLPRMGDTTQLANVVVRGVNERAWQVRNNVRITDGHAPTSGRAEVCVGSRLVGRFPNTQIGQAIHFAGRNWDVVCHFGAGGSAFDHALAQVERWPPAERARRFEAFVTRLLQLLARDDLQPRSVQPRIPLTVGGNGRSVLRVAARHADRWNTYVGWQLPREEGRRVTRERNAELDRLCREAGRDPRTLLRSALIGHSFVAETPFASQHAFREFCLAYEDAGIDELIVYWPPEFAMPEDAFEPGLFERLFG